MSYNARNLINKMFNTHIYTHTNKTTFYEERILRRNECMLTNNATVDCSTAPETLQQQCEADTKRCLQHLKNQNIRPIPTNLKFPDDPPLEWFGPETLLLEAGAIKATISLIKVTRITRSGEYILRIVDNGVDKAVSVSRKFYDTYLRKHIDKLGNVIQKVNPFSYRRNINKTTAATQQYERYTINGILERIQREGLRIEPSTRVANQYVLTGPNGNLRVVGIEIEKNGAISMDMPLSIQGKGYTTALYVAISRYFKKPIVMSKDLIPTEFDKNGNIIERGGEYIWEQLKKIEGAWYEKGGRTYFDAN